MSMTDTPTDLFSQQAANRRRSFWLIVVFVLFFAWLGFGGDWIFWQLTLDAPEGAYRHVFPWMGIVLTGFALVGVAVAWTRGPERVLWSANAREIIDALVSRGESFASKLASLSDADLDEQVAFPPPVKPASKSRFDMLLSVKEHEMHHRGQLMLIERMLGIVPHLTRQRQQRSAAANEQAGTPAS